MENTDVVVLTLIIVILFVSFGVSTFLEFRRMNKNDYTGHERADDTKIFVGFLGKLFS